MSKKKETALMRTAGEIEKRRKVVVDLMFQGTPVSVMADICGVDRRTIESDVRYIEKQSLDRIQEMLKNRGKVDSMIGDMLTSLEYIRQNALMEYAGATSEMGKNGFLNTAMKATTAMTRLLTETGVLPKAGQDITLRTEHRVTFSEKYGEDSPLKALDDSKKRRKIIESVGKVLKIAAPKTKD